MTGSDVSEHGQTAAETDAFAPPERRHFDRLFDMSIDMLCVAGFDGYFKRLNKSWSKILGYTNEQLCAKPFVDFVHPDDVASTVAAAAKLAEGDVVVTFENRYRAADGSYRWLQWNAGPDLANQLIYAVGRDITELKHLERQQQEQLAREAHQQGSIEMAAGILHDLGNALTGMGTRAVELQARLQTENIDHNLRRLAAFLKTNEPAIAQVLGETKAKALGDLADAIATEQDKMRMAGLDSATKLLAFVGHGQDLITTYRNYSGAGVSPAAAQLSIQKLILDAQLMMGDGIAKRGAVLDLKCEPNLPPVIAERTKVMQVLINVLKNAAEAFDGYSSPACAPHISIFARNADGGVAIDVRDNGCGFDPSMTESLFRDGFSTKGRGSGIGLGATRRVVESLGGKISLTSNGPGKGATATIWFATRRGKHGTT